MSLSILTQPPPLILAKAPVKFVIESDETVRPMRITAAVSGEDGDSVQADAAFRAAFEMSDYLQGLISLRGYAAPVPQVYANVPKPVTFDFGEWSGNPLHETYTLNNQGPYYLLDAYVPKSRRAALYATHSNLISYLIYSKSCLSWWPDGEAKRILPTTREFINYLQLYSANAITITLSATLLFSDGTTGATGTLFTVNNVDYMKLVYFPTGLADLGLAAIMAATYPTKTLAGYTVIVKSGSTPISKAYTYTIDTAYYENPRTLMLRNAFGLWEILVCTGTGAQENGIKPETAVTDGATLPDKIALRLEETRTVKVNTGHLSAAQMQWLGDMDFCEAYEVAGASMLPVVFKDMVLPVVHDGEYQYSGELEYDYANYEFTESATK